MLFRTNKRKWKIEEAFAAGSGGKTKKKLGSDAHTENFQPNVLLPHEAQKSFKYCIFCSRSLSKYQHWMVVISAIWILPNDVPASPNSFTWLPPLPGYISVIQSTKEYPWLFLYCTCSNVSFLPTPTTVLWWQLLFVTDPETAGQLESVG